MSIFSEQSGGCAICGVQLTIYEGLSSNDAVVDHDHDTDQIRGLLCRRCNLGIGYFDDNPENVLRAAEYLLKAVDTERGAA